MQTPKPVKSKQNIIQPINLTKPSNPNNALTKLNKQHYNAATIQTPTQIPIRKLTQPNPTTLISNHQTRPKVTQTKRKTQQ